MMNRLRHKTANALSRKRRVRSIISGTHSVPRLSVHISSRHIYAQIIDDDAQRTIASVTTVGVQSMKGNMSDKAGKVGDEIAKKAKEAKIKRVVFDRGNRLYHGRMKNLADHARSSGLEF